MLPMAYRKLNGPKLEAQRMVRIAPELNAALVRIAEAEGVPVSDVIRRACEAEVRQAS